jgi:hypothetical protein
MFREGDYRGWVRFKEPLINNKLWKHLLVVMLPRQVGAQHDSDPSGSLRAETRSEFFSKN